MTFQVLAPFENLLLLVPYLMDEGDKVKGFMNHFAKIR